MKSLKMFLIYMITIIIPFALFSFLLHGCFKPELNLSKIKEGYPLENVQLVLQTNEHADSVAQRLNDKKILSENIKWIDDNEDYTDSPAHWDAAVEWSFFLFQYEYKYIAIYDNYVVFGTDFNHLNKKSKKLFYKTLKIILQTNDNEVINQKIQSMGIMSDYTYLQKIGKNTLKTVKDLNN